MEDENIMSGGEHQQKDKKGKSSKSINKEKEKELESVSRPKRKLKFRDPSYHFGLVPHDDQFPIPINKIEEETSIDSVFNPVLHDLTLIPAIFLNSRLKEMGKGEQEKDSKEDIIYGAINELPVSIE